MKTLLSITMLVLITITTVVSSRLFVHAHYNVSALLTITSYVAVILLVNFLSNKKVVLG